MKVYLAVAASCVLIANITGAATVKLSVAADATVDQVLPGTNLGSDTNVKAQDSTDGGERPVSKGYLMFDASGLPPVKDIESFTVFYSTKRGRSASYFLITGKGANDWTEEAITWNNAPANVPATDLDGFTAGEGQNVIHLGSNTGNPGELGEIVFGSEKSSAQDAKQALIKALNSGDRKATVAFSHNGTRFYNIAARESGKPPATLTLVVAD
ncbi:DUF7594 domain-containing protein [Ruficoccus amylovorans]|nr:DNRLRE domain-containing protein [Ruficoccus amylovorans]